MRRTRPGALPSVLLLVLLAATACTSAADHSDDPPRRAPSTAPSTTAAAPGTELPLPELDATDLPEITTAPRPVWTSSGAGLRGELFIEVVDDLALVTTPRSEVAVDLRSSRTLWRADDDDYLDLPGETSVSTGLLSVPTAAGPLLVSSYYANGCAFGCPVPDAYHSEQKGIVARDARTGEVVWGQGLVGSSQASYLRPGDRDDDLVVLPLAAGPEVVVAAAGDGGVLLSRDPDATLPTYSVGLDPATGERLWSRRGIFVEAVVGGVVVGYVNDADAPVLVGLDPRTGKDLWRTDEPIPFFGVTSASPRVIVLEREDEVLLLDTTTGRPLDQQPPPGTRSCASWVDGPLDVACAWRSPDDYDDARLLTVDADGALTLSAASTDLTPDILTGGAVVVDDIGDGPGAILDAAGRSLLAERRQQVVALGERYLVVGDQTRTSSAWRELTILRRG